MGGSPGSETKLRANDYDSSGTTRKSLMKIAKYGPNRIAAVVGGKLVDLNLACAAHGQKLGEPLPYEYANARVPSDLLAFIKAGRPALDAAYAAVEHARNNDRGPGGEPLSLELASTPLRAPLPSLGSKLICMGRNFASHSD